MKNTISFLIFTYFCIVSQFCVAMENKQNELQLIKKLSIIKPNSIISYVTKDTILADDAKSLYLIDINNEKTTPIKIEANYYSTIAIHPNKSQIAFTSILLNRQQEVLELYDIPTKETKRLIEPESSIFIFAFNPHNNDIFLGFNDKLQGIRITNIFRNNNYFKSVSTDFVFHPQKNLLCVIECGNISIYNPNDLTIQPKNIHFPGENISYNWDKKRSPISSEGVIAIKNSDNTRVFIIDLNADNMMNQFLPQTSKQIQSSVNEIFDTILFYPKSSILITVSITCNYSTPYKYSTFLKFWNTTTLQLIHKILLSGKEDSICSVSPNGKEMIIQSNDTYGVYAIPEEVQYESIKQAVYSLLVLKNYSNFYQTLPTEIIRLILLRYWDMT